MKKYVLQFLYMYFFGYVESTLKYIRGIVKDYISQWEK